jgi:hypothetical protein
MFHQLVKLLKTYSFFSSICVHYEKIKEMHCKEDLSRPYKALREYFINTSAHFFYHLSGIF